MPDGIDIFLLFPELAAIDRERLQAYCDEWLRRPIAREYGVEIISVDHNLLLSINLDPAHVERVGDRIFLPIDQLLDYVVDRHFPDRDDRRRLHDSIRRTRLRWADFGRDYAASIGRRGRLFVTCKNPECRAELETAHEGVEGWTVTCPETEQTCPVCGTSFNCDGSDLHLRLNG